MKRTITALTCCVSGVLLIAAGLSSTILTRAAQKTSATSKPSEKIRRILPEDIPGLPPEFVEKLKERNCSVPQFDEGTAGSSSEPNNVIHGEFAKAGQSRIGRFTVFERTDLHDCNFLGESGALPRFAGAIG